MGPSAVCFRSAKFVPYLRTFAFIGAALCKLIVVIRGEAALTMLDRLQNRRKQTSLNWSPTEG
jgi:hypothetical protein